MSGNSTRHFFAVFLLNVISIILFIGMMILRGTQQGLLQSQALFSVQQKFAHVVEQLKGPVAGWACFTGVTHIFPVPEI